jgi:hypothetical protein
MGSKQEYGSLMLLMQRFVSVALAAQQHVITLTCPHAELQLAPLAAPSNTLPTTHTTAHGHTHLPTPDC